MPYIATPTLGNYRKLTNISSGFNGATTTFQLSVPPGGAANYVTPGSTYQLIISVGGVIQEPGVDYTLNVSQIVFTTAPTAGLSFFGILMGDAVNIGAPADGTITTAKLTPGLTVTHALGAASTPSITFTSNTNTGIYSPGTNQVAISTNGSGRLFVTSAGSVGIGTDTPFRRMEISATNAQMALRSANTGASELYFSDTDSNIIGSLSYSHSTDSLAFNVNAAERLRITSAGLVGIGTSSPGYLLTVSGGATSLAANNYLRFGGAIFASGDGSVDNYLFSGSNAITVRNAADNASLVTIKNSGAVGIGTTSPSALLDVYKGSGSSYVDSILLSNSSAPGANQGIAWGSSTNISGRIKGADDGAYGTHLIFENRTGGPSTTTTERARIDSSGRLLVGTSSARSPLTHSPSIQVEGLGYAASTVSVISNSNDSNGAYSFIGKSRGTSLGSNTIVQSGDEIGGLDFIAADGTQLLRAARITALVDGTPGANDMPGRLVFSTTADGASSPTERMRIDNAGRVMIGATTFAGKGLSLQPNGGIISDYNGTITFTHFEVKNNNGSVGSIQSNGSSTAYNTSSDYRLKENVIPVADGITRLKQLNPSRFNFITDPDRTVDGFIAHEVQPVVPEAITGEKDAEDEDGNPIYQGIDQSKMVPLVVAALQEAIAKIEILELEVNDLKALTGLK